MAVRNLGQRTRGATVVAPGIHSVKQRASPAADRFTARTGEDRSTGRAGKDGVNCSKPFVQTDAEVGPRSARDMLAS